MAGTNFNIRGIFPEVMELLKQQAKKQHISVNILILKLIEQGIGYSHAIQRPSYHELDSLAGTWSNSDAKEFEKNTQLFERIDEELWK